MSIEFSPYQAPPQVLLCKEVINGWPELLATILIATSGVTMSTHREISITQGEQIIAKMKELQSEVKK